MHYHQFNPTLRAAMIPTAIAATLLLVGARRGWIVLPDPAGDLQRAIAAQVDSEDREVCEHFGFHQGSTSHQFCMRELLDVRRRDQELRITTDF